MKALRWIAWASAVVAGIIIILACIALITGKNLFGVVHAINYFHVANSFLLMAMVLFIVTKNCCCCCEDKEGKK